MQSIKFVLVFPEYHAIRFHIQPAILPNSKKNVREFFLFKIIIHYIDDEAAMNHRQINLIWEKLNWKRFLTSLGEGMVVIKGKQSFEHQVSQANNHLQKKTVR